ncbi:hypothetical protein T4D_7749 [Trichinella pseudospiralis]|nr:hypothetical protein T4D_7749 [Trichinella pseudospiralis]
MRERWKQGNLEVAEFITVRTSLISWGWGYSTNGAPGRAPNGQRLYFPGQVLYAIHRPVGLSECSIDVSTLCPAIA